MPPDIYPHFPSVAQLVEHRTLNPQVAGSTPAGGTKHPNPTQVTVVKSHLPKG